MKLHLDRIIVRFLWSSCSKPLIGWYIKHNGITVTEEEKASFHSFRDLFARTRQETIIDITPDHLISPCDGLLSAFQIDQNSCFSIKNSHYRIKDFLQDEEIAKNYLGGTCLIFRLCVSDYHHYCYIDDGYQGKNHFIPGVLHSIQPIACEKYPVFVLNKRSWCLLTTEHFGPVVQCEIGALVVGGIFNAKENIRFCKGAEKGHFELSGSTIILLFEQGQMRLRPEIASQLLPKNRQNFHEIIVLLSVTFFWNCCVYSGARWIAKAWHHYDMTTSLDLLTPFAPWTVSIYLGCYVFWCINYYLCTLQEKTERDRFFCADALAKTLCFLFFLIIPTTNVRPEITEYQNIWDLLMKLVYRFDEADNLFPSIHCLVSWLCWIGVRKRKDIPIGYRYFSLITAVAVCISTLTTKQHVIADVIGGVLLAELCYILSDFPKVCRNYSVIYSHLFGKVKRNM